MRYADVIVDISLQKLDRTFSYAVPGELEESVRPGVKVLVSFGTRTLSGFVLDVADHPAEGISPEKIKPIISVDEKAVSIESELIELAAFMKKQYGCTMNQALKTVLPSKKRISARKQKVEQTPITEEDRENDAVSVVLNAEQRAAVDGILGNYPKPALIYGITGSGKTQVYMELIDEMIRRGRQTILLIPEISLTFQNLRRFGLRYGERVGVVNSRLSDGEKYQVFEKAKNGEIDVIIGPRSALFTPFPALGMIIADEEHETAYLSETAPRYKTVEVAMERGRISGACVVLGSATPLVEDYKKALSGEYGLYELSYRAIPGSSLPRVSIVDMKEELRSGNKTIFSRRLAEAMRERLNKKEQIMLFINRRGYAGFVSCRSCGYVLKCPHCDVSMTAHTFAGDSEGGRRRARGLMCHYCGYEIPMPDACPSCGSPYIAGFGLGTEKVEEMVHKYFPGARTLRMDTDTTSGKAGHSRILSRFASGKADVLIGTQMIVKGHDFPKVTLVGIMAADLSLYSNDFRAGERTFQLLTQAAGRAGRAQEMGAVVIQTYNPDNSTIIAAAHQDYRSFYEEEIAYRALLGYPPEGEMLSVLMTHPSDEEVHREAGMLTALISHEFGDGLLQIVGPSDAGVRKVQDKFRCIFYVKHPDRELLLRVRDTIALQSVGSSLQMDLL